MNPSDWEAVVRKRLPGLPRWMAIELAQHLADLHQELRRRGCDETEAIREVEAALSDRGRLTGEASRAARRDTRRATAGWQAGQQSSFGVRPMLTTVLKDVVYALRMLRRQPLFSAVTVLTLVLGIGVNVAVFGVARAALLGSAPVEDPSRLVAVFSWAAAGGDHYDFSYPLYVDIRDQASSQAALVAYTSDNVGVSIGDRRERLLAEFTTSNYFSTLGLTVRHGRDFAGEDERHGAPAVVIISDSLWRSMFAADAKVAGRTVTIDGQPATIIGVAQPGFTGFVRGQRADLWLSVNQMFPLRHRPDMLDQRDTSWLSLVGRLRDGTTVAQAEAALTAAYKRNARPEDAASGVIRTRPALAGDTSLVQGLEQPMKMLMLLVAAVLVIAATNVAGLVLARSWSRQQEIAIRQSLGASRTRVAQQFMIEAAVLATIGAAGALAAGISIARVLEVRVSGVALALDVKPDLPLIAFAAVLALLAAVAIGAAPALSIPKRLQRTTGLRAGNGSRVTGSHRWLRGGLIVVQVALSLLLVCGAAVFARSLSNLKSIAPSLQTDRTVAATLNMTLRGLSEEQAQRFYGDILAATRRQPGVEAAALGYVLPVTAGGLRENLRARATTPAVDAPIEFDMVSVSSDFFRAMNIPLLGGRDFLPSDDARAPNVIIINAQMKERFWPSTTAIGDTFATGPGPAHRYIVVGVARETKYRSLREKPRMTMYLPVAQFYEPSMNLIVRSGLPVETVTAELREAVRSVDPIMPLYNVRTLAEHVNRSLYIDRLRATLFSVLAILALVLSAIGLYGVIAFDVVQRRRELGIRLALGAQRRGILAMLLAQGARLALAGVLAGTLLTLWAGPYVTSQLYNVSPTDPLMIAGAGGTLIAVALMATWLPARRAMAIDPMSAVREE
jgi:putative ABC transport system permease protein